MIRKSCELGIETIEELKNIKTLPAIPKVVLEVNEMLQTHTGDIARLTEIIGKDQGLTTKILAIANSPLYGLPRRVSSLEFGIMLLGIGEIANIVTALSLASVIKSHDIDDFDFMEFWVHSMMVGTAAKDIAKRLGFPEIAGDAFVAGMLHDVGIQLTARYLPKQFKKIVELIKNEDRTHIDAEFEVLGVTHEDIGHFLISKWNLPNNLAEVLGYHHYPSRLEKKNMALDIVHLADSMTRIFDVGSFVWDTGVELDESILGNLGFADQSELEQFINEYEEIFRDTASGMEL